jgi:hypothetical protein
MLRYFAALGHVCPSTTNPADFVLDLVSVDLREENNEAISREKVQNLIHQFDASQQSEKLAVQDKSKAEELGLAGLEGRDHTPMYIAMPILIERGLLCFKRRPDLAVARIMQVVGLGVFIALFFAPLKTDYFSFQNRLGVIQQILAREFRPFSVRILTAWGAYLRISLLCRHIAERWSIPIRERCILQGRVEHLRLLSVCSPPYRSTQTGHTLSIRSSLYT